jgi:carbon monoxide dehydrogenase subunit G
VDELARRGAGQYNAARPQEPAVATPNIEFAGQEHFDAPPERLYALLTDLDAMAGTIPDLVSSERADDRTLKCVVRPGFSFLRGTMRLAITLGDCAPSERAAMTVEAQGIGVAMQIASQLAILPEGAGARLEWTARIEQLKGLIAAVSPALIKAAADQVIRHAWTRVRDQLGEPPR